MLQSIRFGRLGCGDVFAALAGLEKTVRDAARMPTSQNRDMGAPCSVAGWRITSHLSTPSAKLAGTPVCDETAGMRYPTVMIR
jgi:hypothetical protein